jgi:hypothetical protein
MNEYVKSYFQGLEKTAAATTPNMSNPIANSLSQSSGNDFSQAFGANAAQASSGSNKLFNPDKSRGGPVEFSQRLRGAKDLVAGTTKGLGNLFSGGVKAQAAGGAQVAENIYNPVSHYLGGAMKGFQAIGDKAMGAVKDGLQSVASRPSPAPMSPQQRTEKRMADFRGGNKPLPGPQPDEAPQPPQQIQLAQAGQ